MEEDRKMVWKLQRCSLILEYQFKIFIPPPLRFIYSLYALKRKERKIVFGELFLLSLSYAASVDSFLFFLENYSFLVGNKKPIMSFEEQIDEAKENEKSQIFNNKIIENIHQLLQIIKERIDKQSDKAKKNEKNNQIIENIHQNIKKIVERIDTNSGKNHNFFHDYYSQSTTISNIYETQNLKESLKLKISKTISKAIRNLFNTNLNLRNLGKINTGYGAKIIAIIDKLLQNSLILPNIYKAIIENGKKTDEILLILKNQHSSKIVSPPISPSVPTKTSNSIKLIFTRLVL